jgi:predicted small secreted protein
MNPVRPILNLYVYFIEKRQEHSILIYTNEKRSNRMNAMKKNVFIALSLAITAAFFAGCQTVGGIGGAMSSEMPSEKVIKVEFKLDETEGKIVGFVSQMGWIRSPMDLRTALTNSLNIALVEKAEIEKDRLTEYAQVKKIRIELPQDKRDDPFETALKAGAKYVLVIEVMDFDLSTFAEKNFYNGTMTTKSCLYDIERKKLWPAEGCKEATVIIEAESGTMESAVGKLSNAAAFCVTRYFYDCKAVRFRIAEEQKELDPDKW